MAWTKIGGYATNIPDTLPLFTPTWREHILSQWHWLLLLLLMVVVSVTALLHRRYRQDRFTEEEWEDFIAPVQDSKDSPFFAYLGHNILTQGCPHDPNNTSMDAIGRISESPRFERATLHEVSEEPLEYNTDINDVSPSLHQYRSYTYPDSQNKQIRYDRVEQLRDTDPDRQWQRRTVHVYAI